MPSYIRPYRPVKVVPQPKAIRMLPLDLKRTSLVTRQPEVAGAAAAKFHQYMSGHGAPPMMLPQSLQFNHWNRQPGGIVEGNMPPARASAMGVVRALRQSGTARAPRVVGPAPYSPIAQEAARIAGQRIPQPNLATSIAPPISRRFPSPPPVMTPPPSAIVQQYEQMGELRRAERTYKRSLATGQVLRMREGIQAIVGNKR